MPKDMYKDLIKKAGEELVQGLEKNNEHLKKMSEEYYNLISKLRDRESVFRVIISPYYQIPPKKENDDLEIIPLDERVDISGRKSIENIVGEATTKFIEKNKREAEKMEYAVFVIEGDTMIPVNEKYWEKYLPKRNKHPKI